MQVQSDTYCCMQVPMHTYLPSYLPTTNLFKSVNSGNPRNIKFARPRSSPHFSVEIFKLFGKLGSQLINYLLIQPPSIKDSNSLRASGYGRRITFQRSWGRILALYTGWTFFTYICCKNYYYVCLKRPKINNKRGRGWPILKKDLNSAAQAIVPKIIPLEQRAF